MGWGFTALVLLDKSRLVGQARIIEAMPLQLRGLKIRKSMQKAGIWGMLRPLCERFSSGPLGNPNSL